MKFTKNNKIGYLQAIISFFIVESAFLPFVHENSHSAVSAIWAFTSFLTFDFKTEMGVFFVIFIMLELINIFVQSKKNIGILTIITAGSGIIPLTMYNSYLNSLEIWHPEYQYGFYLIVVMLSLQAVIQVLAFLQYLSKQTEMETATDYTTPVELEEKPIEQITENRKIEIKANNEEIRNTEVAAEEVENLELEDNEQEVLEAEAETLRAQQAMLKEAEEMKQQYEKEKQEKEQLEEEYRMLKEKAEQVKKEQEEKERIERERIERARLEREKIEQIRLEQERIEKEKLEKERQEKEKLINEIAKLKEILKNN